MSEMTEACRFRPSKPPWPSQMCAGCGEWREDHQQAPDARDEPRETADV